MAHGRVVAVAVAAHAQAVAAAAGAVVAEADVAAAADAAESCAMTQSNHLKGRTMTPHMPSFKTLAAAAAFAALSLASGASFAQHAYPSPDAAAQAFADAIASSDVSALRTVLGPDWRRFVPEGSVDRDDIYDFLGAWAKQHKTVLEKPDRAHLAAGDGDWTLPIPIVKGAAGWRFDTHAGADQMRSRRIGRNELSAMQAVLAYFDAQKEYAQKDRDGNGVLEYADKFASTPGKHDGLYWPDAQGQDPSPLGPLYSGSKGGSGYHGYHFKILKAQGKDAPGGAYDYVISGRMRAGFALVAWPIRYGETGVMSLIVSHDGTVYEKDLGPGTDAAARAMVRFNPDASWRKVAVPGS
ncbi:DUF2950 domain-containing protein [Variovorax sp. J22R133]|uniref:DUF2950 domain-containing protein n=1 Tax=Variovorax brevis TaxID=3053503 RepID=UPI0025758643|nr:DUF2950 domain-containing protein [Variovorax sp. J22R133]MDM0110870.1 DUF2950 domain-containing protein [Variovorax sp. J22R133]